MSMYQAQQQVLYQKQVLHQKKQMYQAQQRQHQQSQVIRAQPSPQLKRKRARREYAPLNMVGRGTFADIWEVYDAANSSAHFALKTLRKAKCHDAQGKPDARKYQRYNAAVLNEGKRLVHLNRRDPQCRAQLVRCRDIMLPKEVIQQPNLAAAIAGTDGKNPIGTCLVLELMGVSFIHFLQYRKHKQAPISLQTVRFIALQLLNVVSFLHSANCIHADLKPENIMITLTHSMGDQLLVNAHPDIKVVDMGNTLTVGRECGTFEVQSLHFRAPELLFGNELTAAMDLWSVGCILLELTGQCEYARGLNAAIQKKLNAAAAGGRSRMHPSAVFASRSKAMLVARINQQLSAFPAYFYNEFNSFIWGKYGANVKFHCDVDYNRLRLQRRQKLIERMRPDAATVKKLSGDAEFCDYLDLVARLLDPNPATRYTAEDATQHCFCIGLGYVRDDARVFELLSTRFDSNYPRVSISNDNDRQRRLQKQMKQYEANRAAEEAPRPPGRVVVRGISHDDVCSDPAVRHSRAVCLVYGCCGNPTLLETKKVDINHVI